MADERAPLARLVVAAVAVVAVGGTLIVVFGGSGGLTPSPTCDDVEPGGSRLRSSPPPGASPVLPQPGTQEQDEADVQAAFRPESAEAVYCEDLADPFVLALDELLGQDLLVYGTQTADLNIALFTASGPFRGEQLGGALPELPAWSAPGGTWAPAVLPRDDTFVLYYTTTDEASGLQCISTATSEDPGEPFEDNSTQPLVCPTELGGAIDPSPFVGDDGRAYLLWKNDGNCCGVPVKIFAQALSDDGQRLVGPAQEVLAVTQRWEGSIIEAPAMTEHDGRLYLFYSGNVWNTADYAIGYATCAGPQGPCAKPLDGPWLASTGRAAGPGGQELYTDGDGETRMVFHAWSAGTVGYEAGGFRALFTVGLDFIDGRPVTTA